MEMLTWKDASHLISESHERPLGLWERLGLKMHLWMCVGCRRFERQMTLLRLAVRALGKHPEAVDDGAEFPPEARERIRKALTERRDRQH